MKLAPRVAPWASFDDGSPPVALHCMVALKVCGKMWDGILAVLQSVENPAGGGVFWTKLEKKGRRETIWNRMGG